MASTVRNSASTIANANVDLDLDLKELSDLMARPVVMWKMMMRSYQAYVVQRLKRRSALS